MKYLALIAAFCIALALSACGGGDSSANSSQPSVTANSDQQSASADSIQQSAAPSPNEGQVATNKKPKVKPPPPPLPDELVIHDLVEGSGPEVKPGDDLIVDYVGVDKHGKELYTSWDDSEPLSFKLGNGTYFPGWEEGFEGMKVGGRREMVMPAKSTRTLGFLVYIVDLRRID